MNTMFRFTGDYPTAFADIRVPDGSTLLAKPGEDFDLDKDNAAKLRDLDRDDIEEVDTTTAKKSRLARKQAAADRAVKQGLADGASPESTSDHADPGDGGTGDEDPPATD